MIGWALHLAPLLVPVIGLTTVQGTSDCPSPAAVAAVLQGLSTPGRAGDDEVAFIDAAGSDLAITIVAGDGSLRLNRRLPRADASPDACSALAAAVAVMLASWDIEQRQDLSLSQAGVEPPPPAPPTIFRAEPPEPPGLSRGAELSIGVALGMAMSASSALVTGQVQLGVRRRGGRAGLWLTLAIDGEGDLSQAGGTSTWRRTTAGLGPWLALGRGAVTGEVGAQLFVGRTSVHGSGFAEDRSDHVTSPGVEAVARLVGPGELQPFLEGGVRGWFAPQEVDVLDPSQASSRASLPRVDGRLVAGVRVRFGS